LILTQNAKHRRQHFFKPALHQGDKKQVKFLQFYFPLEIYSFTSTRIGANSLLTERCNELRIIDATMPKRKQQFPNTDKQKKVPKKKRDQISIV